MVYWVKRALFPKGPCILPFTIWFLSMFRLTQLTSLIVFEFREALGSVPLIVDTHLFTYPLTFRVQGQNYSSQIKVETESLQ